VTRVVFIAAFVLAVFSEGLTAERVDFFDQQGGRTGYAVVNPETGRIDLYDAHSNRTGYGYVRPDGSIDVFNMNGTRRATITPGIGGRPGRIIVPGKR
jgi:hypothetical protein